MFWVFLATVLLTTATTAITLLTNNVDPIAPPMCTAPKSSHCPAVNGPCSTTELACSMCVAQRLLRKQSTADYLKAGFLKTYFSSFTFARKFLHSQLILPMNKKKVVTPVTSAKPSSNPRTKPRNLSIVWMWFYNPAVG